MRALIFLIFLLHIQGVLLKCEDGYDGCLNCKDRISENGVLKKSNVRIVQIFGESDEKDESWTESKSQSDSQSTQSVLMQMVHMDNYYKASTAVETGATGNNPHNSEPQNPHTSQTTGCNWCMRQSCNPGACRAAKTFNPTKDAERIRNAVEGLGTTESELIDILIHRSEDQLEEIRKAYQKLGRVMDKDIDDDTEWKIKDLFQALLKRRPEFYADELKEAFKNKKSSAILMILTSLPPCAILEIGSAYNKRHHTDIFNAAQNAAKFDYKKFIIELIRADRDPEGPVDREQAKKDAELLQRSESEHRMIADGHAFIKVFTKRSYAHIRQVKSEYEDMGFGNFNDNMAQKSGNPMVKQGLTIILNNIEDQTKYFADMIQDAIDSPIPFIIKDIKMLVLILRGRCGLDLGDILKTYASYHEKSIIEKLEQRSWGDYEDALVEMCQEQKV
ncbi:annexin A5-like isoform X2 [Macrosteles quadrilineatus]|uniref:annexin A5-like isoform X2 n=1 Tax=Macrosteles quadrilineatus TaxID=74068 RepID=UPI0023E1B669|nr:annexin A5-like isoform X2 [Macrosteles quadrilineatus]